LQFGPEENPDRSQQYIDATPEKLRDQLNENWRQLRLFRAALSDRDQVIGELHNSISQRDELIASQNKKLILMNRLRPLLYACIGGAVSELGKFGIMQILRISR